jgi:hypothetical protein
MPRTSASRYCRVCRKPIPKERIAALPQTTTCVFCSDEEPTQGLIEFGHKTAPSLVILPNDPEQRRRARRSFRRAR